jgi:two-component system, LytTR family, response regulator
MTNNFTCIIVDDEPNAIELLIDRLGKLHKNITVTGTHTFWEDALNALRTQQCDLLIMDMSIPGKNGMEILKLLPKLECELIFVTAYEDFALDAFAFSASGYVLKPVDDSELSAAVNTAIERIQHKRTSRQIQNMGAQVSDKIGISHNNGIDYINVNDILYLESINKCTKIVTASSEHLSSLNIGKFLNLTHTHSFFQVHRSYIVNLNSILRYESSGLIIMSNKIEIPVSRSIRNEFLKIFSSIS